jgi:hypothetical protein
MPGRFKATPRLQFVVDELPTGVVDGTPAR